MNNNKLLTKEQKKERNRDFIIAIQNNNLFMVKKCIEDGETAHIKDYLPIQYALASGYLEVAKYLIANGAQDRLDANNEHDCWGFVWSANNQHENVIDYLSTQVKNHEKILIHPDLEPHGKKLWIKHLQPQITKKESNNLKKEIKENKKNLKPLIL